MGSLGQTLRNILKLESPDLEQVTMFGVSSFGVSGFRNFRVSSLE